MKSRQLNVTFISSLDQTHTWFTGRILRKNHKIFLTNATNKANTIPSNYKNQSYKRKNKLPKNNCTLFRQWSLGFSSSFFFLVFVINNRFMKLLRVCWKWLQSPTAAVINAVVGSLLEQWMKKERTRAHLAVEKEEVIRVAVSRQIGKRREDIKKPKTNSWDPLCYTHLMVQNTLNFILFRH